MTAGPDIDRHGGGFQASVRASRLPRPNRTGWILLGLVVAGIVLDGARGFAPAYPRGDLLYHWGLTHAILRGELPPGGPYQGLPAYYPPGYHLLLAAISFVTSIPVESATWLFGLLWLPILPLATFALARIVTGRSAVALAATALTIFAGGFEFSPDRLWVNSLFLSGQQAYPLFPRDLVFGVLPLAVAAFLRALEPGRTWAWAIVAGGLLGACGLIQIQLLLPLPIALAVVAVASAVHDPTRWRRVIVDLVVTAAVATLLVAPWLASIAGSIRRNGGVGLDSADTLLPLRIGLWDYPREFGLLLPLAVVGIGLVLIHLRERDPVTTGLRPRLPEAPLVLVPWFAVPWILAVFYDPGWPLEDALRPQPLWLISSQPGAILAAIGLLAVTRWLLDTWRRPRLVRAAMVAVLLIVTVPTMAFTLRLLFDTWTQPIYVHLRVDRDRVPDMSSLLGDRGPRSTVLTYEDWSSLAWYDTGSWVVAVKPPGYAKLAFDPAVFTGHDQASRREDLSRAFTGDPAALAAVADEYGALRILVARRGDRVGMIDQVAAVVATQPGGTAGDTAIVQGNGSDSVALNPGARLLTRPLVPNVPIDLEIRVASRVNDRAVPDRRVRLVAVGPAGERALTDLVAPAAPADDWQVIRSTVTLQPGERLAIDAVDPIVVQSLRGFVPGAPPDGWDVGAATDDAVVFDRSS